ncbi:hypothetical protein KPA97_24180, partial [Burkholderia cenocepacia]|nr:hypothetical protein [Burkholderia cenocepacia]
MRVEPIFDSRSLRETRGSDGRHRPNDRRGKGRLGVDAGLGGNNTLNLQLNPAAGSSASGTLAVDTYGNFTHLAVQGGTWNITGASSAADASLAGGTAIINNSAGLGLGTIAAGGGTLEAGTAGLNLLNNVTLG